MDVRKNIIPPTEQVKKILTKLADLPQDAKKELKDKEDMQKEINKLRGEVHLAKQNRPVIDETAITKAEQRAYKDAESQFQKEIGRLKHEYNQLQRLLEATGQAISSAMSKYPPETKEISIEKTQLLKPTNLVRISNHIAQPIQRVPLPSRSNDMDNGEIRLDRCAKILYSFLYAYPGRAFTKSQIGAVTGYSSTSGGFNNAISKLGSLNLIKRQGDILQVNEMNDEIALTFDFSINNILNILNKCEKEIYQVLLDNPYSEYSKEELAENTVTHYSSGSGGFNNSLSRLSTLGLIIKNGGTIRLNPNLLEI
jgi:hypothetical protein